MKTDETQIGIVIESYDEGENQIIVTDAPEPTIGKHHFFFFFLPQRPIVNFGDTILMDLESEKFWVHRGNPRLTYQLFPQIFPNTLLLELVSERINN